MLLILRSSAAFSLLKGSLGSLRFFSLGTSPARGWRWPTGANGVDPEVAPPDVDPLWLPVCATAAPPSKTTSDTATMIFFMSLPPFLKPASPSRPFRSRADRGERRRNNPRYDSAFPMPHHPHQVRYFASATRNSAPPATCRRRRECR